MRKLLLSSFAALAMGVMAVGCLKDKGYEDQQYGVIVQPTKAVSFPQTTASPVIFGIDAVNTPQSVDAPGIVVETSTAPTTDVKVTLTTNDGLVTDAGLTPLSATQFQVQGGMTITIPAGQKYAVAKIIIPDATILDPTKAYGIGFTISSVDGGYAIPANFKNVVIGFTIKNKYDGIYNLRGVHNRPTLDAPYNQTVHLITTGPNSVKMFWPALGADAHPINGNSYYSDFTTDFFFDATTNKLIDVQNAYSPGSPPFTIGPATDSRYDPATKKIYAQYYYNANLQRMFSDTLTYLGPR